MADFYIEPKNDDPQRVLELNGVPSKFYLTALEVNTIVKFLSAILGLETALYKGEHPSLEHLELAHPLPEPGSEAQIIVVDGDNLKASWDNTNKKWFLDGVYVAPGSNAAYLLKSVHDVNGNGIIDKAEHIHSVLTAGGTKYYGTKNGVVGVFDFPDSGSNNGGSTPTTYLKSYLIAWTGIGWEYQVTASFVHNGISYTDTRKVTLLPDGTHGRFARFVVNLQTLQAAVIHGDPSANPLEPAIDPVIHLDSDRLILIPANSVTPPNINVKVVYRENLGVAGGELNINPPGPDFDLANGESPKSGAVAIKGVDLNQSQSVSFSSPDPILIADAKFIGYDIKNIVGGAHTIGIQGARSNGQLRTIYLAAPSTVGYDPANTESYQRIVLPIPSDTLVNVDRISFIAGFDGMGYYLDNVELQSGEGVSEPVSGDYVTHPELEAARLSAISSSNNYTDTKISDNEKFRGTFLTLAALQAAIPVGQEGWSADVDAGEGAPVKRHIWDANEGWIAQSGEIAGETAASIRTKYLSNAGTEEFTTTYKNKVDSITAIFTTGLKTAYDNAVTWINTNGANILNRLTALETGKAPIPVTASRNLAASDNGANLCSGTPGITITYPAGGLGASFRINCTTNASGTFQLNNSNGTTTGGTFLPENSIGHVFVWPNGSLTTQGDWE